jgi:hypothetical protein
VAVTSRCPLRAIPLLVHEEVPVQEQLVQLKVVGVIGDANGIWMKPIAPET